MVQAILNSIRSAISSTSRQNSEFKTEAVRNNKNITSAVKDISKMFSAQSRSDAKQSRSLDNIESYTMSTSSKVDRSNALIQESISIQSQMLAEIKNMSSLLSSQASGGSGGGESSGGSSISQKAMRAATAALGLGTAAAAFTAGGGFEALTGVSGLGDDGGGGSSDTGGSVSGEKLSVGAMTKLAKEAGFTDEQAAIMGAIGAAESSGRTNAHNPNAGTGDNSYGLWQINMLGRMGPERRRMFGIENNEELFDAKKNAEAAKKIFDQQGFKAWSVYKSGAYRQYLGTARESLQEGDETGTTTSNNPQPKSNAMGGSGGNVYERQKELAGIRKLPLSDNLKRVLNQAAAAAGVDVVVYSGGQAAKGQKGPRTGSTRHDNGNAADLYLLRGGKKLSDTNPEDRAVMAKFVSAAVAAGATGVGAGHGYMGSSNIHVGFGKQATWGGAPWIKQAASGVYSNQDLQAQGGGGSGGGYADSSGGGSGGGGAETAGGGLSALMGAMGALGFGGIGGAGIMGMLSSFFGIPMGQMFDQNAVAAYGGGGTGSGGSGGGHGYIPNESQEKEPDGTDQPGRSRGAGGPLIGSDQYKELQQSLKKQQIESGSSYDESAGLIQASAISQNSPVIRTAQNESMVTGQNPEVSTNFNTTPDTGNYDSRASWAPRIAAMVPDRRTTQNLNWASRIA